jgi:ABC-type multidrug transport system permease subunit
MSRWRPFTHLFLARVREFYREPAVLMWVYAFPLLLAVGLSLAFSSGLPAMPGGEGQGPTAAAVRDDLAPAEASALTEQLRATGITVETGDQVECQRRLRGGRVAVIVVPSASNYDYIYDSQRPDGVLARYRIDDVVQKWKAGLAAWPTHDRLVEEPGSRYIDFLIPGLMGLNLMSGGLWGVGYVVTDLRVRKLLKRLLATPMRRSDFLLSIVASRLVLLVPEMLLFALVGAYGFGVPFRGSVVTLALLLLAGGAAFAGIGLLAASRAGRTETISGVINLLTMPMWMLAGTFFSPARFPEFMQPLIRALPLTHLNDALRDVILDGASLTAVAGRLAILAGWAAVTFLLGLLWFRWQ